MAVEIKYVVVRKDEEKMTFASKKEADNYDRMLDMAEVFTDWLIERQPDLDEQQAETLGLLLAEQKDTVQQIFRTSKRPEAESEAEKKPEVAAEKASADDEADGTDKVSAIKAA